MGNVNVGAPERLRDTHLIAAFDSGRPVLNDWLRQRALRNEVSGASRTYVACAGDDVAGYYCLSTGAVESRAAPGGIRRNMPDPIPIMLLGRLAVDLSWQGQGLGRALLKDAILRTLAAAEIAGIRALLVHALDEEAAGFYWRNGLAPSPQDNLVLMLGLETARRACD